MVLVHVAWSTVKQRSDGVFERDPRRSFFKVGQFKPLDVDSSEKVWNDLFQSLDSLEGFTQSFF